MRAWLLLLGGLLVWAAHFFALYVVASIFPGTAMARYLALTLTLVAAAAAAGILWRTSRALRNPDIEPLTAWIAGLAAAGGGIALVAILYQSAPLFLV